MLADPGLSASFELPPPPGYDAPAIWTGRGFSVNGRLLPLLSYEIGESGWKAGLTTLHEAVDDEDHYMNLASREHALSRLRRYLRAPRPRIIDVGCSTGYMLKALRARFPHAIVAGADITREPLEKLARSMPEVALFHLDILRSPLPENTFDAAILLNVLEHIADDQAVLRHVYRFLKPGGVAVIEVPAGPGLYDIYDRQLLHYRRYRLADLVERLRAADFHILDRSHLGFLLYPAFWMVKKKNRRLLQSDPSSQLPKVEKQMRMAGHGSLMHAVLLLEQRLRDWIYYPAGIRCLVTCRK